MKKIPIVLLLFLVPLVGNAATKNGNDLALFLSEATTKAELDELLDEARGDPHYFRYLQIMEKEEGIKNGQPYVKITAFEPSSYMDIHFVVTKRVSRAKLIEAPVSEVGDAIAITGVVKGMKKNTLYCSPVIVRHKDKLTPGRGKEMFYEVDPSGRFYSFTGGKREAVLTFKDRDLLQNKGRIQKEHGEYWKEEWAEFLIREVAKRDKVRKAKARAHAAKIKAEALKK